MSPEVGKLYLLDSGVNLLYVSSLGNPIHERQVVVGYLDEELHPCVWDFGKFKRSTISEVKTADDAPECCREIAERFLSR